MNSALAALAAASVLLPVAAWATDPQYVPKPPPEFLRFTAPDPLALRRAIEEARIKLAGAEARADGAAVVDHAADLGGMLTTAREEAAALSVLDQHQSLAEQFPHKEQAAWFWNAVATALQYQGKREQADRYFAKAVGIARDGKWKQIEAMTLHHWGRSLTEQGLFDEAKSRFEQAVSIREEIRDPREQSSRKALEELATLRSSK